MSCCAAKIRIGWITGCYEADDPCGIIAEAENDQSFDCLLQMGRMEGTRKDQKELDKLRAFLEKYWDGTLTMEDIRGLNIHLSVGSIVCLGIAETENEVEALKG